MTVQGFARSTVLTCKVCGEKFVGRGAAAKARAHAQFNNAPIHYKYNPGQEVVHYENIVRIVALGAGRNKRGRHVPAYRVKVVGIAENFMDDFPADLLLIFFGFGPKPVDTELNVYEIELKHLQGKGSS